MTVLELLTLEEMAEILRVKKSWVYARTRDGSIPHLKIGKYCRFELDKVLAWIKEQSE